MIMEITLTFTLQMVAIPKTRKVTAVPAITWEKNSGLLIVIPDELDKPLTKVSVSLKENEN